MHRATRQLSLVLAFLVAAASRASAQPLTNVTLGFEGVTPGAPVGIHYDGGAGGSYGITFTNGTVQSGPGGLWLAAIDLAQPIVLDFARGFRNQVTFSARQSQLATPDCGYTNADGLFVSCLIPNSTVSAFAGFGGTGAILGSTPVGAGTSFTIAFTDPDAIGRSLVFEQASPTGYQFTYDDRQLQLVGTGGPSSTVPEPGTVALVASGLLAVGGVARRRRACRA